ncbi:MAG: hypothetical protein R3A13_11660 [Bdellovibrionota bacterium]
MPKDSSNVQLILSEDQPATRVIGIKNSSQYSRTPEWLDYSQNLLRSTSFNPAEICEKCLEIFDLMISTEANGLIGEEGLKELFINLYWSQEVFQYASLTYGKLKSARDKLIVGKKTDLNWVEIINAIDHILSWFMRRIRNLDQLATLDSQSDEVNLFGVQIIHDVKENGVFGFEVVAGAQISGFSSQELWLELQMFQDGNPINVKPEAKGWSQPVIYPRVVQDSKLPLHFGLPVRVSTQFKIFDRLNMFIPYSILDLPSGLFPAELVLSLVDTKGKALSSASSLTLLRIIEENSPTVSPSEVGAWKYNTQTGEFLEASEIKISPGVCGNWEEPCLEVEFGGLVISRQQEDLQLELKIISSDGELALGVSQQYQDREGYFSQIDRLTIPENFYKFAGYKTKIPIKAFEISTGTTWHLELSLTAQDGTVICSLQRRIGPHNVLWCVNVDELYAQEKASASLLSLNFKTDNLPQDPTSKSLLIDVTELDHHTENTITYCWLSPRWLETDASPFQSGSVVYGLRSELGSILDNSLLFQIPYGDLVRFISTESQGDQEFVVTVMQFNTLGNCLRCVQDFISISADSFHDVQRSTIDSKQQAKILSVKAVYNKNLKAYSGTIILNLNIEALQKGLMIYYELLDEDHKAVGINSSRMKVPGTSGVAQILENSGLEQGVIQRHLRFNLPTPEKGLFAGGKKYILKIVLFGATDRIIDTYHLAISDLDELDSDDSFLEDALLTYIKEQTCRLKVS